MRINALETLAMLATADGLSKEDKREITLFTDICIVQETFSRFREPLKKDRRALYVLASKPAVH